MSKISKLNTNYLKHLPALFLSTCSLAAASDPVVPPMVNIPAGEFMMGSDTGDDRSKPSHLVTLPDFQMAKYLVTVAEFRRFMEDSNHTIEANCVDSIDEHWFGGEYKGTANWNQHRFLESDYQPVTCVTWDDANAYAKWLSDKTGTPYRLPNEEEWEYALKANTSSRFFWGDDLNLTQACSYGNFADHSGEHFASLEYGASYVGFIGHNNCDDGEPYNSIVGLYRPNPFGLYDMVGNVKQHIGSCYYDGYQSRSDEEKDVNKCERMSFRGTIWHFTPDPIYTRGGFKKTWAPGAMHGFRLAKDGHNNKGKNAEASSTQTFEANLKRAQQQRKATRPKVLSTPQNIQLININKYTYQLSWQPVDDNKVTAYEIYQSTSAHAHLQGKFYKKHYKKIESVKAPKHSIEITMPETGGSFRVVAQSKTESSLPSPIVSSIESKTLAIPGQLNLSDVSTLENAHLRYKKAKDDKPGYYYLLKFTLADQTVSKATFNVEVKKSAWYQLNYDGKRGGAGVFFNLWHDNHLVANISYDKNHDDTTSKRHKVFLEKGSYPLELSVNRETPDRWQMNWLKFTELED